MSVVARTPRMSRDEFLDWVETQTIRYEFDGFQPVAMVGSFVNHNRIVRNIHAALRSRLQGSACEAFGPDDGLATINDIVRYPDAFISCTKVHGEARLVDGAVIVFEVLSPGNSANVEQNFFGATVLRRHEDSWTATALTVGDTLRLHPPAIEIAIPELYEGVDLPSSETP